MPHRHLVNIIRCLPQRGLLQNSRLCWAWAAWGDRDQNASTETAPTQAATLRKHSAQQPRTTRAAVSW
eukprot:7807918-Alexandrium_andersonii.AAC.1